MRKVQSRNPNYSWNPNYSGIRKVIQPQVCLCFNRSSLGLIYYPFQKRNFFSRGAVDLCVTRPRIGCSVEYNSVSFFLYYLVCMHVCTNIAQLWFKRYEPELSTTWFWHERWNSAYISITILELKATFSNISAVVYPKRKLWNIGEVVQLAMESIWQSNLFNYVFADIFFFNSTI